MRMGVTIGQRHYLSRDNIPAQVFERPFVRCEDCSERCRGDNPGPLGGCRAGERRRHV